MTSRTKEEMFLIKLYEMAEKLGDAFTFINPSLVGKAIFVKDKRVQNIIQQLTQANFTRKSDGLISLTPHGLRLVENLRLK